MLVDIFLHVHDMALSHPMSFDASRELLEFFVAFWDLNEQLESHRKLDLNRIR